MYERFTDRARKVMQLANREAKRFQHEYIDTQRLKPISADQTCDAGCSNGVVDLQS